MSKSSKPSLVVVPKRFNIIRHRGQQNKAETLNLDRVERKEVFYVPEWHVFVRVASYDNHFVYENKRTNQPAYMCTCGSAAVVVPPVPAGMFVCLYHKRFGVHQGDSRWV